MKTKALLSSILFLFTSYFSNAQWQEINLPSTERVMALAISGNTIFAATANEIFSTGEGIFRSTDNGANWTQVNNGLTNTMVMSLAVAGTTIFAGTYGDGVFVSTDNGASWTPSNTGLTRSYIYSLEANGTDVFAGTDSSGFFLSTDNGLTWTAKNNGIGYEEIRGIAVNGTDVFVGIFDGGLFHSTDYADTWTWLGYYDDVFALEINGPTLFLGNMWGCAGRLHIANNVLEDICPGLPENYAVTGFVFDGATLYECNRQGVYKTTDNGDTWSPHNEGLPNTINLLMTMVKNADYLFTAGDSGKVFKRLLSDTLNTPYCSAVFSLYEDSIPLHYVAENITFGTDPISYFWEWGDGTTANTAYPNHTYANIGTYQVCLTITDAVQCTHTYCSDFTFKTEAQMGYIRVIPASGNSIEDLNNLQVTLYPNPATNTLTISTDLNLKNGQLQIHNAQGQLVIHSTFDVQRSTFDISSLNSGIYFLSLTNGTEVVSKKFVKE
jgi:photosystem II stability/assembly factor-like uncharacterized protein